MKPIVDSCMGGQCWPIVPLFLGVTASCLVCEAHLIVVPLFVFSFGFTAYYSGLFLVADGNARA